MPSTTLLTSRKSSTLSTLLAAAILSTVGSHTLHASILTWDPNKLPASPTDTSGTWDNATPIWSNFNDPTGQSPNSPTDVPWSTNAGGTAVFGNGGGNPTITTNYTITVAAGGITASNITFAPLAVGANNTHVTDYQIVGGAITLGLPTTTITVNNISSQNLAAFPDAEISSQIIGTANLNITGVGALSIGNISAAANNYVGTTTISSSVLIGNVSNTNTRSSTAVTTPFGAANNSVVLSNATITSNASGGTQLYSYNFNLPANSNNFLFGGKATTLGGTTSATYGSVTGSGNLTYNMSGATSNIYASFTSFSGILTINGGGFTRAYINGGNFNGSTTMTLDLEGNGATTTVFTPQTNSGGNTFSFGALTSSTATGVLNGSAAGGMVTYSIGALGSNSVYNGDIGLVPSPNAALTKVGGGSLTLANTDPSAYPYTGATTVSNGTLVVNGTISASATTVSTAGTLAGIGAIALAVTDNGTLNPGATAANSIGNLSFGNGLTLGTTATYAADYNASSSDVLAVTGNLVLTAGDKLLMTPLDSTTSGTFVIATYTGSLTGTFTTIPTNVAVDYSIPGVIKAQVTPEPASLGLLAASAAAVLVRRRSKQ